MLISLGAGWLSGLFGRADDDHEETGEALGGDDEPEPWVVVMEAFDQVQATIAVARLGDEGIMARTRREGISSALPVDVGIIGRIEVLVPESQAEHALMVLDAEPLFDDEENDDGDPTPLTPID